MAETNKSSVESTAKKTTAPAKTAGNIKNAALPEGMDSDSELDKKKGKKKKEKGIIGKLVPLFILALIIASLVGVLYYNFFDIREKYLRSYIDKIPIISGLFPAVDGIIDPFFGLSREDLIAQINELQAELDSIKSDAEDQDQKIEMYLQEISNLKVFEDQQLAFKDDKQNFDSEVAMGDPAAYVKYYEQISPENAADLYSMALETVLNAAEYKNYYNRIASMDSNSAAKALEELIPTDMPIVVEILKNFKTDLCGEILSAMSTQSSAAIIKQMYP